MPLIRQFKLGQRSHLIQEPEQEMTSEIVYLKKKKNKFLQSLYNFILESRSSIIRKIRYLNLLVEFNHIKIREEYNSKILQNCSSLTRKRYTFVESLICFLNMHLQNFQ